MTDWWISKNILKSIMNTSSIKKFTTLGLILLCTSTAFAGTDPAAYLKTGVGARALAMGGAYTSICDDPTAIYWNPAGLALVNQIAFSAMGQSLGSTQWDTLKDIAPSYQFVGVTFPLKSLDLVFPKSTMGVGLISNSLSNVTYSYLDASDVIVRDTFADTENAYFVSYGFALSEPDRIYAGATLKYLTQSFSKISGANATGYDLDAGFLYGISKTANLGLVLQKGAQLTWANGRTDTAGITTKFGASNKFTLTRDLSLLGAIDLAQRKDEPLSTNIGTELGYEPKGIAVGKFSIDGLYVRGGLDGYAIENRYDYLTKINNNLNLTGGFGLNASCFGVFIQFDYSMGFYRLGNENRFTLSIFI